MEKKSFYSGELDVWKLLFALLIVVHHSRYLPGGEGQSWFLGGSIGVEFFFLVSGFLMLGSVEKARSMAGGEHLAAQTGSFMRRKVGAFLPYMLFAFAVSLTAAVIAQRSGMLGFLQLFLHSLPELFVISWSGVNTGILNAPTWYLSVMVLSMLILFPLAVRYGRIFTSGVCPLLALFIMGYLYQKYGQFRAPDEWDGLFYKGMLRGFAEIALGIFCAEVLRWIRGVRFTAFSRLLLTAVACGSFIAVIVYSNGETWWDKDVQWLLLMAISVIIVGGNLSLFSGIWNRCMWLSKWLGKLSLMLYLNHFYWFRILSMYDLQIPYPKMLMVYMVCSLASALVCWGCVDCLRAIWKRYGKIFRKLFVHEEETAICG